MDDRFDIGGRNDGRNYCYDYNTCNTHLRCYTGFLLGVDSVFGIARSHQTGEMGERMQYARR